MFIQHKSLAQPHLNPWASSPKFTPRPNLPSFPKPFRNPPTPRPNQSKRLFQHTIATFFTVRGSRKESGRRSLPKGCFRKRNRSKGRSMRLNSIRWLMGCWGGTVLEVRCLEGWENRWVMSRLTTLLRSKMEKIIRSSKCRMWMMSKYLTNPKNQTKEDRNTYTSAQPPLPNFSQHTISQKSPHPAFRTPITIVRPLPNPLQTLSNTSPPF